MSEAFPVEVLDDAGFISVDALPEPRYSIAWELPDHLRRNPRYGKPLEANVATGDLSDARSLYVIDFDHERVGWPPSYRIVYRLLPSEKHVERVQVIWAGERDSLHVYRVAARRLGR